MRVSSRKYIQRSNLRKNKYSKKIGGSKERKAARKAAVPEPMRRKLNPDQVFRPPSNTRGVGVPVIPTPARPMFKHLLLQEGNHQACLDRTGVSTYWHSNPFLQSNLDENLAQPRHLSPKQ